MANEYEERQNRIERNMEFIIEHQAKFSADIERINATLDRHNEEIAALIRISRSLVDHQSTAEGRMGKIENNMVEVEQKMAEMAAAHKETGERLSAFITYVEKYISSHNGH